MRMAATTSDSGVGGDEVPKTANSQPPDSQKGADEISMFKQLCGNVTTAMMTFNNALHEFLHLKDELLEHQLPSNLLLSLTLKSSRLFRSYSELCIPVGELNRLVLLHSSPWEKNAEGLKRIRSDYESMKRKLSIALKKLEIMGSEEERLKHERRLGYWERLFCHVMQTKSHGRRWKFRIEPLRRKLESGFNPYLSDSDSDDEERNEMEEKLRESRSVDVPDSAKHIRNKLSVLAEEEESRETTPPPPPVVTADASISTADPSYDNYLLVQLSRPSGILTRRDICCTLALGDKFYTSEVFPGKTDPGTLLTSQVFHFPLSDQDASSLPPTCEPSLDSITKLVVGVYPKNTSEDLTASLSLPLVEIKTTEESTVIVPPESREEEFEIEWDKINAEVSAVPVKYSLAVRKKEEEEGLEDDYDDDPPLIPMVCHRVKVQKHPQMHCSTLTLPWNELMSEMGYHQNPDTQSRATSALPYSPTPPTPEEVGPTESEVREQVERESQKHIAELTLQHIEEMQHLQQEYEKKLDSLSTMLSKVKIEKSRQIEDLELALEEMERNRSNRGRSVSDIQRSIARKRRRITHGLPEWGKDLPDDFFERLELFKEESIKKQQELMERIRKEVSEACEKQLATQHKLAPGLRTDIDTTTEDITLPALFMPTSITKHLVYTPRAHKYFHPPGSTENRVTQPPAVFKLPALHSGLQTLNLFELSQHFNQMDLKESSHHHCHATHLVSTRPSSASNYYNTHPVTVTMPRNESAILFEEEEDEDYGGRVRREWEKAATRNT